MSIHSQCTPRPSVFAADRRATVLSLDTFLKGQVNGPEFFEENYFTNGMITLVDRAFRHMEGAGVGSSVFLLSQAMGGGKTHSMIALGLLARDPELRKKVLGEQNPAPMLGRSNVIGFNGRNTDAAGGIWGSISEQLGKAEQFARYLSPLLNAPGPEAWKQLLGSDPLVLFLDELPPYLEYAVAVPVGNADPAQIEQVIMNLGVNARDAMSQGGRLTIETSNVECDESYHRQYPYVQPGRYVQISLTDSGTGMDEETQAHIFEPFFTTKEVGKGTGLGLSMIYGIVKQHDGHINVYSEVGHGTTFKVFLPVAENAVEKETQAVQPSLLGGTETILVAEDEEALRNLARTVLEGLGYTVLLAQDGKEAVEMFEENRARIDMLLFDVVMPHLGGVEAYQQIRERAGDVPLLLMTGYSSETVQSRFVKQNKFIQDLDPVVIQKPYSVDGLGRKVREVFDQARQN